MNSLYLLIPIVILLVGAALGVFFWAVNSGQYDDLETEGRRILFDDDLPAPTADHDPDGDKGSARESVCRSEGH